MVDRNKWDESLRGIENGVRTLLPAPAKAASLANTLLNVLARVCQLVKWLIFARPSLKRIRGIGRGRSAVEQASGIITRLCNDAQMKLGLSSPLFGPEMKRRRIN